MCDIETKRSWDNFENIIYIMIDKKNEMLYGHLNSDGDYDYECISTFFTES